MSINQLELPYEEFLNNKKSIAFTSIDHYIIYEKLGSGAFGSVYRGIDDKTKKEVAIKVLDLLAIEEGESSDYVKLKMRRLAQTESELMMKVDSLHVMKLHSVYQNKKLKIMVIEYCNGGSLSNELNNRGRIPEEEAIEIAKQIIFGLAEMHRMNIIHRDLKADNIMSHNGIYKIIDLGFARIIPEGSEVQGTILGTIITMAPEVMKKQKYGLNADVWSIGVILYEMIYGKLPYEPMKSLDMYEQIMKKDIFPNNGRVNGIRPSNEVIELLKKLLTIDQKQRISWNELLDEKLLQDEQSISEEFRITVSISKLKKFLKSKDNEFEEIEFMDIINKTNDGSDKHSNQYEIRQLSNNEKLQSNIDLARERDEEILKWAVKNHLECLKTELILNEIIIVMETKNVVNLSNRKVIEFLYLLSSRCFFNMSFVLNDYNNEKNPIVGIFKSNVEFLYDKVSKKFQHYSEQLTCKESQITSIMKDKVSQILQNNKYENKNKFLVGNENISFLKEEQILYTEENYIKLIEHMVVKDKKLKCMLINYRNINNISENDVKIRKFHQIIDSMVKNYNSP